MIECGILEYFLLFYFVILINENLFGDIFSYKNGYKRGVMLIFYFKVVIRLNNVKVLEKEDIYIYIKILKYIFYVF